MALNMVCSECGGTKFTTTAHEVHEWVVDGAGNFIEDLGVVDISHKPDSGNVWSCYTCGADGVNTGD